MSPRRPLHPLPPPDWPSREEARGSRLFSPLRLASGLELRTRTWVPAMVPWRATEEGEVTDALVAWYGRFAEGWPGAIVVEATGIRDVPSGPLLRIGHDRYLDGLRRLVEVVKERSGGRTRLFVQLIDFLRIRRRPERKRFLGEFLEVDAALRARLAAHRGQPEWTEAPESMVREELLALDPAGEEAVLDPRQLEAQRKGARERVTDLHLPGVRELPRVLPGLFEDAAERARRAGFDGVELHYAHAYTMASFLSARNTRADGYGASLEGRLRLPLEVLAAVRERVGSDWTVGARILGDEAIAGGTGAEEARRIGRALAGAGLDYLSISKGGKFEDAKTPKVGEAAYPYTGPSGHECMPTVRIDPRGPFGRNVPLAAALRAELRGAGLAVPVVTAGGIAGFRQAEGILARGEADLVAAARQSLADPDWWRLMEEGRGGEIRRCIFTNYCEGLDQKHREVTCQLWDRKPEPGPSEARSRDGRRRLTAPSRTRGS